MFAMPNRVVVIADHGDRQGSQTSDEVVANEALAAKRHKRNSPADV